MRLDQLHGRPGAFALIVPPPTQTKRPRGSLPVDRWREEEWRGCLTHMAVDVISEGIMSACRRGWMGFTRTCKREAKTDELGSIQHETVQGTVHAESSRTNHSHADYRKGGRELLPTVVVARWEILLVL